MPEIPGNKFLHFPETLALSELADAIRDAIVNSGIATKTRIMFAFLPAGTEISPPLDVSYNLALVLLSYLVACIAAFTAWNMSDRISEASARMRPVWLWGGALVMGVGIWSMHFLGMLAMQLPFQVSYDVIITGISVIPALIASLVILSQASKDDLSILRIMLSGLLMAAGIGSMHYLGMAGMNVPAQMFHDFRLFTFSLLIAVVLASLSLGFKSWARKRSRNQETIYLKSVSIALMGLAIAGMHYAATSAVSFHSQLPGAVVDQSPLDSFLLSLVVVAVALSVLFSAIVGSIWGKRLEDVKISLQAYEMADKLKDDFMSTITHELLTPINGVSTSLNLLNEYITDGREYFDTAFESNLELQKLIEKLILFAEARRGHLKMRKSALNIRELLQDAESSFRNYNDNHIEYHCDVDVPEWIIGDENKISVLIKELMKNAVSHTKAGLIALDCSWLQSDSSASPDLLITVKDTGKGIESQMQSHIFEAFAKTGEVFTRHRGVGVGLTLCSDLLNLMQGSIEINSIPGKGTDLRIRIPVQQASVEQITAYQLAHRSSEKSVPATGDSSILVVEDNLTNMTLLIKVLEKLGYNAITATDGEKALQVLENNDDNISAVLMDCQMPVMDGYEATQRIREMGEYRSLPIIAVTANVSEEDRQRCRDSGMDDFLAKPINPALINNTLEKWVH